VRLTCNRRAERNPIGTSFLRELELHLNEAERTGEVRVSVLAGEGDPLSSGMDFAELTATSGDAALLRYEAKQTTAALMAAPDVHRRIDDLLKHGLLPWQSELR